MCRIRNYILNNFFDDETDCIILLDDDCKGIYRWEGVKKIKLTPDEFMEVSEVLTRVCYEWGFRFWGTAPVPDKQSSREGMPFNTLGYIGGPFQAHLKDNKIRYDEGLPLKEDYDITLQHIKEYGGCLRVNWLCYDVKQGMSGTGQTGGCATYRNMDREIEQFRLLQKKWGSDVVRRDKTSKRSFDTNPILKVPLKGV